MTLYIRNSWERKPTLLIHGWKRKDLEKLGLKSKILENIFCSFQLLLKAREERRKYVALKFKTSDACIKSRRILSINFQIPILLSFDFLHRFWEYLTLYMLKILDFLRVCKWGLFIELYYFSLFQLRVANGHK